jgi:hypothetical protein
MAPPGTPRFLYESQPEWSSSSSIQFVGVYVVFDNQTGKTYLCNAAGGIVEIQPSSPKPDKISFHPR